MKMEINGFYFKMNGAIAFYFSEQQDAMLKNGTIQF